MRKEYLLPLLIFIPVIILQTTIIPIISIGSIVPDLTLILLVFFAIQNGQIYGTVSGFAFGFVIDLISGTLLGSTMLTKTLAGFTAGYFSGEAKMEFYLRPMVFPFVVLLCSFIDSMIFSFFLDLSSSASILNLIVEQGLLPALYTAFVSIAMIVFYRGRR